MKKTKHIMELPTNVPRLKKGAGMIELPDGGKYFPGGERYDERKAPTTSESITKDFNKRAFNIDSKGNITGTKNYTSRIIKPSKEQLDMPLKQGMTPRDRKAKDLKDYRKKKKDTFLGLGIGIQDKHPDNINKKNPYRNMDALGKQKKKEIAI
jgi:hypothetical protein